MEGGGENSLWRLHQKKRFFFVSFSSLPDKLIVLFVFEHAVHYVFISTKGFWAAAGDGLLPVLYLDGQNTTTCNKSCLYEAIGGTVLAEASVVGRMFAAALYCFMAKGVSSISSTPL